jgi:hypothetical protein
MLNGASILWSNTDSKNGTVAGYAAADGIAISSRRMPVSSINTRLSALTIRSKTPAQSVHRSTIPAASYKRAAPRGRTAPQHAQVKRAVVISGMKI